MNNRPTPQSVQIRGVVYSILNPSDFRIRQIKEFLDSQISNYARERELAACIQGMIPDMPVDLASCREISVSSGETETLVVFNLQSHELMDIVNAATVGYVEVLISDIEEEIVRQPSNELRDQCATLRKELAIAKEQMAQSSLLVVSRAASAAIKKQASSRKGKADVRQQLIASMKPRPKAQGFTPAVADKAAAADVEWGEPFTDEEDEQKAIAEFVVARRAKLAEEAAV